MRQPRPEVDVCEHSLCTYRCQQTRLRCARGAEVHATINARRSGHEPRAPGHETGNLAALEAPRTLLTRAWHGKQLTQCATVAPRATDARVRPAAFCRGAERGAAGQRTILCFWLSRRSATRVASASSILISLSPTCCFRRATSSASSCAETREASANPGRDLLGIKGTKLGSSVSWPPLLKIQCVFWRKCLFLWRRNPRR